MSINKKLLLIVAGTIFIASLIGIVTLKKYDEGTLYTEYASTSATTNRKAAVEEVVTEVVEDVVQVLPDKAMEQEIKENTKNEEAEKVIQYKDKEITIPKSKVASVNSSEDAERNKKNGGNAVSQNEANTMFENTGTHSKV